MIDFVFYSKIIFSNFAKVCLLSQVLLHMMGELKKQKKTKWNFPL